MKTGLTENHKRLVGEVLLSKENTVTYQLEQL
jgi:hypothetical protein